MRQNTPFSENAGGLFGRQRRCEHGRIAKLERPKIVHRNPRGRRRKEEACNGAKPAIGVGLACVLGRVREFLGPP